MAKVCILIPTYNYAHYLDDAIGCVLGQTFGDFELIVLDNCSTDNTEAVVSKYLNDPRVRYYKNETNIGAIGNFNKALELANGEYIKFLFSDDVLSPDALAEFVDVLDQHPNVTVVTSYFEYFGSTSRVHKQPYSGLIAGMEAIKSSLINDNWIGAPSNIMIRRSAYDKKGFNKKWMWWGDMELWHRLLSKGDLFVIPKVLSMFRYHDDSATSGCFARFENVHDEYYYLKYIRDGNLYPSVVADQDFQSVLKRNARRWIAHIPAFYKSKRYGLIRKGIFAIFQEQLTKEYFASFFRKVKRQFQ